MAGKIKEMYLHSDFQNNNKTMLKSKRSQVTIWIIIAIVIVALIIFFFAIRGKQVLEILTPSMPNPQSYIESCAKENARNAVDIMLPQAGYLTPENYKLYNNNKVAYLCYTNLYYKPCINQNPEYIEHLKSEILKYIKPKIEDCFYNFKQEYEKKNYKISMQEGSYNVELNPRQIAVEIDKKLEITKNEEARSYDKFKIKVNSPIYDLALIAVEIANQEAKFCYFEYLGYSLLYPDYEIEKTDINSDTKIYTIKEKKSGKKLLIAIKSCAFPEGI